MRKLLLLVLALPALAGADALVIDHIPNGQFPSSANTPGALIGGVPSSSAWGLEITFRLDPDKFDAGQSYQCGSWVPQGYFLYDTWRSNARGWKIAAIGGNGRLCFMDVPGYSWGAWTYRAQLDVSVGTCHTLTASRSASGQLTVSLDGQSVQINEEAGNVSYGGNSIGLGREGNEYGEGANWDSFPGEIYSVVQNGVPVDLAGAQLTGGAYYDAAASCGGIPEPEPEPEPEPTACELDPTSVECACETTPHPACNVCLSP